MDDKTTTQAIDLFKREYGKGKTPEEMGFPAIGIYEEKESFLYARDEAMFALHKKKQKIIFWTMTRYFPIMVLAVAFLVLAPVFWGEDSYPVLYCILAFIGIWLVVFCILAYRYWRITSLLNSKGGVIFLEIPKTDKPQDAQEEQRS